jgi:pilus assembly protein CpaE
LHAGLAQRANYIGRERTRPEGVSLVASTVLIVDDSPTAVPELKAVLENAEFTVITALRAEEALETLRATKVDAVICEALLPGMDGFTLIRQIRANPAWANLPIIMLSVRSAPEDYAAGFDAGANDYFVKPLEPPKIVAAVGGGIKRGDAMARIASAAPTTAPMAYVGPKVKERGDLISVFSLKGGVGTTTIAVNVAVAIKRWAPSARVGIIDLSLEEALDSLLLDIMPTSTIVEWAQEDLSVATPNQLNQYFVQHSSGVSLMCAPQSPEQAEIVKPSVVRRTLELAPLVFDYVVIDTPAAFSEIALIALEASAHILLPVTPDMAALKSTVSTLRILKALTIQQSRVKVLLNEIIPRAGLTKEQLETGLGKQTFSIPHAGSSFVEAANQGTPIVLADPRSVGARALIELAKSLCEPEVQSLEPETPHESGGLLSRFRPR